MRVKIAGTLILAASAFLLTLLSSGAVFAAETVTVSNFTRAKTDMYFASVIAQSGGLGRRAQQLPAGVTRLELRRAASHLMCINP